MFEAELGHTPANDAALREFAEYLDKLIEIGEADASDKKAFLDHLAQGLHLDEDTRLNQEAEEVAQRKESRHRR